MGALGFVFWGFGFGLDLGFWAYLFFGLEPRSFPDFGPGVRVKGSVGGFQGIDPF